MVRRGQVRRFMSFVAACQLCDYTQFAGEEEGIALLGQMVKHMREQGWRQRTIQVRRDVWRKCWLCPKCAKEAK